MAAQEQKRNAVHEVFNITELRLEIFSYLPAKTLLTSQRVSRPWNETITTETALQQRLFFAPGPGELVFGASIRERHSFNNDDLYKSCPRPTPEEDPDGSVSHLDMEVCVSTPVYTPLVPGFACQISNQLHIMNPFLSLLWPQMVPKKLDHSYSNGREVPIARPEASWRRMQLLSPPLHFLEVDVYPVDHGLGIDTAIKTGVTLGDLANSMESVSENLSMGHSRLYLYVWKCLWSADDVGLAGGVEVLKARNGDNDEEMRTARMRMAKMGESVWVRISEDAGLKAANDS